MSAMGMFRSQAAIPIEKAKRQTMINAAHHAANNAQSSFLSLSFCLLSDFQTISPVTKRVDPINQICNASVIGAVMPDLFMAV